MFYVNQKSSEDPLFDFCFSYDVLSLFSLSVSLCDLVKKFHLWSLACPGFLTCILSLWKNCAHLPSVSCQNSTQLLYSFLCVFLLPHKHTLPDFDRVPHSSLIFNISSELQRNDRTWAHFNKIMELILYPWHLYQYKHNMCRPVKITTFSASILSQK